MVLVQNIDIYNRKLILISRTIFLSIQLAFIPAERPEWEPSSKESWKERGHSKCPFLVDYVKLVMNFFFAIRVVCVYIYILNKLHVLNLFIYFILFYFNKLYIKLVKWFQDEKNIALEEKLDAWERVSVAWWF